MSRSRAATPAGKRRSTVRTARPAHRSKPAASRTRASGRHGAKAPAKRAPAKRRAPKRATTKRSSTKRSPAKRAPSRRAPARARGSWRARLLVGGAARLALAAGYFFWLRDSSLVAVDDVEVVGVTGGERERIVAELTRVAEEMTTLHVRPEAIERAAAAFPTVESVSVDANFPHGMRIEVNERPPGCWSRPAEREVPVAADGTLLAGVEVPEDGAAGARGRRSVPATGRLGGEPLEQALIVGAAPEPLRPLIEKIASLGASSGSRSCSAARSRCASAAARAPRRSGPRRPRCSPTRSWMRSPTSTCGCPSARRSAGRRRPPETDRASSLGRDFRIYVNPRSAVEG